MQWNHELYRHRVSEIAGPFDVEYEGFQGQIVAKKVDGSWFPEFWPAYDYDEVGASLDLALTQMITAPFDASVRYASAEQCRDAASARFREAVKSLGTKRL